MKKNLALFCLVFPVIAHSSGIGTIVKLKGEVSILAPGDHQAHQAILNEPLKKDSSILTKDKSFVQIVLNDQSKVNLGANSKIVLDAFGDKKDDTKMVSMLKGHLRSIVKKAEDRAENRNKEKMIIKTPSAAMAVRGTKFQIVYNNINQITALVTVEGKVAMKKIDKKTFIDLIPQKEKSAEIIKNEEVIVDEGRYAGSNPNLEKVTVPVTISPEQFAKLSVTEDFSEGQNQTVEQAKEHLADVTKDRKEDPKEKFDQEKKEFKPKSGGIVDLETGFYIRPSDDSKVDKKFNVFVEKDADQKVDQNGNFVPDEKVILDPLKGFIAKDQKTEVQALNQAIGVTQLPKKLKPSEKDLELDPESAYDKYYQSK